MGEPLATTTGLCAVCLRSVPAEVRRGGAGVALRKRCPEHGEAEAPVAADAGWYARIMTTPPVLTASPDAATPVSRGCPFDCGPCAAHQQSVALPIVPITSACNLDCPICYTHNRNEGAWHMSEAELRAVLGHLRRADPERRIVNLTGGEPTLHPRFERLLELCAEEGIVRITVSTHGLRFLKEPHLLELLARLDARVVLSFDSLEAQANRRLLGGDLLEAKLRVLELLSRHGVSTTLLPVVGAGVNDHELGRFVALALEHPVVRSLELHTMTFTGAGGAAFDRGARLTPDRVLSSIEQQTGGLVRKDDFIPSPLAHPLCYQVAYLLRLLDGRWVPFLRFMRAADLRALLGRSLYLQPGPAVEATLREVIDRLWTGEAEGGDVVLPALRALLDRLTAPGLDERSRLRAAEATTRAIYLHAHMDAETFDTDRVRRCPVGIREPDGRNIPSCSYNVLYRARDARFRAAPEAPLVTLGRGRIDR